MRIEHVAPNRWIIDLPVIDTLKPMPAPLTDRERLASTLAHACGEAMMSTASRNANEILSIIDDAREQAKKLVEIEHQKGYRG